VKPWVGVVCTNNHGQVQLQIRKQTIIASKVAVVKKEACKAEVYNKAK